MSQLHKATHISSQLSGLILLCITFSGCSSNGNNTASTTSPSCVLASLAATAPQGTASPLQIGQLIQFTATEGCTSGTSQTLSATDVTWTTSNADVISVSSTGLATAVASGAAKISFSYQGVQSTGPTYTVEMGCQLGTALSGTWSGTDSTGAVEKWDLSSCGTSFAGTIASGSSSGSLSSSITGVISGGSVSFSGSQTTTAMDGTTCIGTLTGQGTFTSTTMTVQYSGSGSTANGNRCADISASVTLTKQ